MSYRKMLTVLANDTAAFCLQVNIGLLMWTCQPSVWGMILVGLTTMALHLIVERLSFLPGSRPKWEAYVQESWRTQKRSFLISMALLLAFIALLIFLEASAPVRSVVLPPLPRLVIILANVAAPFYGWFFALARLRKTQRFEVATRQTNIHLLTGEPLERPS
ncbi:hypothetical protein EON80_19960 [bacterium]|nr:MAG: hypothetical protein EON80_19960 [bacterium]